MEYTINQYVYFFLLYSFAGWIFEEIVAAFRFGKFVYRGFVNGPLCMKYGAVMVILLIDFKDLMDYPLFQFIAAFVVIIAIQYIAGAVMQKLTGKKLFDYSDEPWNLNGYVHFFYALVLTVFSMSLIWFVHPLFFVVYELVPLSVMRLIVWIFAGIFLADVFLTVVVAKNSRLQNELYETMAVQLEKTKEKLGQRIYGWLQKRMYQAFPEMKQQEKTEKDGFGVPGKNRVFAKGMCFDKLIWIFFVSALVGDWIETVFVWGVSGTLMSRSSLIYGTFSIVWGFGGAIVSWLLYTIRNKNVIYMFVAGFFMGGVYEYSCSVFTEVVFGTTFWDYSGMKFNINGRINLLFCIFWGILAIVWLKVVYPTVSRIIERIPPVAGTIFTWMIIVLMVFDMTVSAVALTRYSARREGAVANNQIEHYLDRVYSDALLERIYPNMKWKVQADE